MAHSIVQKSLSCVMAPRPFCCLSSSSLPGCDRCLSTYKPGTTSLRSSPSRSSAPREKATSAQSTLNGERLLFTVASGTRNAIYSPFAEFMVRNWHSRIVVGLSRCTIFHANSMGGASFHSSSPITPSISGAVRQTEDVICWGSSPARPSSCPDRRRPMIPMSSREGFIACTFQLRYFAVRCYSHTVPVH